MLPDHPSLRAVHKTEAILAHYLLLAGEEEKDVVRMTIGCGVRDPISL